jgi:hypothetical protein
MPAKGSKPATRVTTNEIRNKRHRVPRVEQQAQRAMRDRRLALLDATQERAALVRGGSEAERQLRDELVRRFAGEPADLERYAAEAVADYASAFDRAILYEWPDGIFDTHWPDVVMDPPPPPDGEFWWASTDWHTQRGINADFLTDGLHFWGFAAYRDDPLISFSAGSVAHFELHANRRPHSNIGRWASLPAIDLFGRIEGMTGFYHWLYAADDKWAKCWLVLRQTAYQLVPHDFGVPGMHAVPQAVVVAERVERRTLIDEENNGRFVDAFLSGFTPMPAVEFGLVNPNLSVWVDLEVRFDMQLEGWSQLAFSPEQNPMGSVVLRTPQWRIQAL